MAGTSIYSVYRRTARAAAKQQVVKKTSSVDVEKARSDFAYFCDVVGDKPPAEHMKLWHEHLYTHQDSECLINIACLLYTSPSPRDGLLSRMPSSA